MAAAKKTGSKRSARKSSTSGSRAKAAKTSPPKAPARRGDTKPQGKDAAELERRAAQPHLVSGPGSGTTLRTAPDRKGKQSEIKDLLDLVEPDADTWVVLKAEVYEDVLAPGTKDRYIQRVLWAKGTKVRKSVLEAHIAAQRKRAEEAGE